MMYRTKLAWELRLLVDVALLVVDVKSRIE
jgi:hypothetical protein